MKKMEMKKMEMEKMEMEKMEMEKIKFENNTSSSEDFDNWLFCQKDLTPLVLRENSNILVHLDEETISKMENGNYRIVINISTYDFQSFLIYKDLQKGIDNLLRWEWAITKEYEIDKGSSFRHINKGYDGNDVIKCDRIITKVTIISEEETLKQRSQEYIYNFVNKYFQNITLANEMPINYNRELYTDSLKLLADSSEFLKYIDEDAFEDILAGRRFFIFANVSFKSELVDDTITMSHSMRGLGDLLSFERYLFKKCCDWASNSFYDFDQPVEFKYDSVEICFEM